VTPRRVAAVAALTGVTLVIAWVLFVGLPRWYRDPTSDTPARASAPPPSAGRKIKANLFYVADDGTRLTSVEREVPYGESTAEQARAIVSAQIAPVADPLVSAVPPGTALRALFITSAGEAYVDLSRELVTAHPGGSTSEMLTIYTFVDVLTANLPAVTSVQLLVEGRELDTLAGHVDLRRPLVRKVQ
jgi:spore germination protein GerM